VGTIRSHLTSLATMTTRRGGKTGNPDPMVSYYHDVPRALAEEALRRERGESRRLVRERLGITPDEVEGGPCVALSRPKDLADLLVGYV
jgi:hypothetical protein